MASTRGNKGFRPLLRPDAPISSVNWFIREHFPGLFQHSGRGRSFNKGYVNLGKQDSYLSDEDEDESWEWDSSEEEEPELDSYEEEKEDNSYWDMTGEPVYPFLEYEDNQQDELDTPKFLHMLNQLKPIIPSLYTHSAKKEEDKPVYKNRKLASRIYRLVEKLEKQFKHQNGTRKQILLESVKEMAKKLIVKSKPKGHHWANHVKPKKIDNGEIDQLVAKLTEYFDDGNRMRPTTQFATTDSGSSSIDTTKYPFENVHGMDGFPDVNHVRLALYLKDLTQDMARYIENVMMSSPEIVCDGLRNAYACAKLFDPTAKFSANRPKPGRILNPHRNKNGNGIETIMIRLVVFLNQLTRSSFRNWRMIDFIKENLSGGYDDKTFESEWLYSFE